MAAATVSTIQSAALSSQLAVLSGTAKPRSSGLSLARVPLSHLLKFQSLRLDNVSHGQRLDSKRQFVVSAEYRLQGSDSWSTVKGITMSTVASLQRGLVGSSQRLSSSKDGEVFCSRSELNRACMLPSKLGSWSFSRHLGVSRPRAQENDFTPSEPSREEAGNGRERYPRTTYRDIWVKGQGDGRAQGRGGGKVSSYGNASSSKTPNSASPSRTSSPREPSSQVVSDQSDKLPWELVSDSGRSSKPMPRKRNPLIERLKRMQAEIAKDEAAAAAAALAAEKVVNPEGDGLGLNSEGEGIVPNLDRVLRDFDDEARFDGSSESSAVARFDEVATAALAAEKVVNSESDGLGLNSEGEGFVPKLDRVLRDSEDEARFDGSSESSAMAPVVQGNGVQPETSGREVQRA